MPALIVEVGGLCVSPNKDKGLDQSLGSWLTDKSFTPHPPTPAPTRGEGELELKPWLEAPLPLWERGWDEGTGVLSVNQAGQLPFRHYAIQGVEALLSRPEW